MSHTAPGAGARGLPSRLWPSAKQEVLLRAVFGAEAESKAAWDDLLPAFDLDRLEEGSFALMPLLYRRVEARDVDDPVVPRLKGLYRHTWYRNNVLLERLKDVLRIVAAARGEALIGGELRLLVGAYRDYGLRPSNRIDLLVGAETIPKLAQALDRAGWNASAKTLGGERHRTVWFERADSPTVALHRRLLLRRGPAQTEHEPWQHTVELDLDGSAKAAVSATDELLRLCIGEERQLVWNRLAWIADSKLLLDAEGERVDWERALAAAAAYRATLPLFDALGYLRDQVGAAVPEDVLVGVEQTGPTQRELLAHRWSRVDHSSLGEKLPAIARRAIRRARGRS